MAVDPVSNQLLLFGGIDLNGARLQDTWTALVYQAPAITSGNSAAFSVATAGTFTVTTTGLPAPVLRAAGALPNGVTFVDNHNGTVTISGTPLGGTAGVYPLTIIASNGNLPDASQSFTLTVTQGFRIYLPFVPT